MRQEAGQTEYFVVMTLAGPDGLWLTADAIVRPEPGEAAQDIYTGMRAQMVSDNPGYEGAPVVFYSAQPNRI
jgi:hypothetical protein